MGEYVFVNGEKDFVCLVAVLLFSLFILSILVPATTAIYCSLQKFVQQLCIVEALLFCMLAVGPPVLHWLNLFLPRIK